MARVSTRLTRTSISGMRDTTSVSSVKTMSQGSVRCARTRSAKLAASDPTKATRSVDGSPGLALAIATLLGFLIGLPAWSRGRRRSIPWQGIGPLDRGSARLPGSGRPVLEDLVYRVPVVGGGDGHTVDRIGQLGQGGRPRAHDDQLLSSAVVEKAR